MRSVSFGTKATEEELERQKCLKYEIIVKGSEQEWKGMNGKVLPNVRHLGGKQTDYG